MFEYQNIECIGSIFSYIDLDFWLGRCLYDCRLATQIFDELIQLLDLKHQEFDGFICRISVLDELLKFLDSFDPCIH